MHIYIHVYKYVNTQTPAQQSHLPHAHGVSWPPLPYYRCARPIRAEARQKCHKRDLYIPKETNKRDQIISKET